MKNSIFIVATVLAVPSPAFSWTQSKSSQGVGLRWFTNCLKVYINEKGSSDVDDDSDLDAVKSALNEWSQVECSSMRLAFAGLTNIEKTGYTGEDPVVNVVIWRERKWPYSQRPIAYTAVTYNPTTGEIVDADIEMNGEDFVFTTDPAKHHWMIDIQNTVTHELGHAVGLDHSDDELATMYAASAPGETHKRTLNEDDIAGLCTLYPIETGTKCEEVKVQTLYVDFPDSTQSGGCSAGRGNPALLTSALLIAAFTALLVRQKLRRGG